jgi:hypothetical protein
MSIEKTKRADELQAQNQRGEFIVSSGIVCEAIATLD